MATIRHLFFLLSILPLTTSAAMTEMEALLLLKKSFTNAQSLDSWDPGLPVCGENNNSWVGVICFNNTIKNLRLGRMNLSGKIDVDALVHLPTLRSISFVNNSFSGPVPSFNKLSALRAMYLSGNKFSGEIPTDFFSNMMSMKKIWLAKNSFTGAIPESLANLKNLIELHLEDNGFSGVIPPIDQPALISFDVSNNSLSGEIPVSLNRFGKRSFAGGNEGLCGELVGKKCHDPGEGDEQGLSSKVTAVSIAAIVVICMVGLMVTARSRLQKKELDMHGYETGVDAHLPAASRESSVASKDLQLGEFQPPSSKVVTSPVPQLTIVNEEKGVFGLPDLMKAAAEVLGIGGLGSCYKAVMESGVAVVVKRMKEMNRAGDYDRFEEEMRRLGRLRHPNVLPPLAFHFRKEEKLLVYEFIPSGSLLNLLHGERGQNYPEVLTWPMRLKIIRGIARGVYYIHQELAGSSLPHGNLKSSNVLLGPDLDPILVDYGYSPLIASRQASQSLFAYRSPEAILNRHVSPKSDVYCFGILVLEILTGKFPSQYLLPHGEGGGHDLLQMVASAISERRESDVYDPEIAGSEILYPSMERCLWLGSACGEPDPELRPDMAEALLQIEEIVAADEEFMS